MSALRKIEYGVPTEESGVTVRLGIEAGIFAEEGLDVSMKTVFGGPQIAAAFDSGELLIGEMGSPPAINAIAAGKRFRIIASGCRQQAQMYLCVRSDIEDYEGLRGTRLGLLGLGSCPDWIARQILASNGLDAEKDLTIVPLLEDHGKIVAMIEDGRLDAALCAEPIASIGEERGIMKVWAAGYDHPAMRRFQWLVRVARTDLIEQEPDLIAALLRGCRRAAHYAVDNQDQLVALMIRHHGADEASARRALARDMPRYELDCRLDMAGLQKAVEMQLDLGGIERQITAESLVDSRFQPALSDAI